MLKIDGSEALVLAMQDYNVGTTYKFRSSVGGAYALGDLDVLLNNTIYGEMNDLVSSAIVTNNNNQGIWYE